MQSEHPNVFGTTAISGIYDLEPMQYCYVNDLLKLNEDTVKRNSPLLLSQEPSKIIDIFVGNSELELMQNQSIQFAQYRKKNNALGEFINVPHANHYTILDELTREDGVILESLKKRIHAIQSKD
jgi:arylformamidase